MVSYVVTLGKPGGGAGTFQIVITALTPGMARNIAMAQYPGFSTHSVKVTH